VEEKPLRALTGLWNKFIIAMSIALILFQLYTAMFGNFIDMMQRSVHLFLVVPIMFFKLPATKKQAGSSKVPWYDLSFAILGMAGCLFVFIYNKALMINAMRWMGPLGGRLDMMLAVVMVLLCLEMSRRSVGWIFPIMALILFFYAFQGQLFPGMWAHKNMTFNSIFWQIFHTTNGIWGSMLSLSAGMLAMFSIFGEILGNTGGAMTFIKVGQKLTSNTVGGSGKVSLLCSALFGMISGSVMSNVLATGTFTIPMMKEDGYTKEWAGAISAVGATGGQIMPPIMGSGAFIMAQLLSVSYMVIAKSAIVPALLFYFGSFVAVHYVSKKFGVLGHKETVSFSLSEGVIIVLPLVVFIGLLVMGYTVTKSAFWATVTSFVTCMVFYFMENKGDTKKAALQTGSLCYKTAISSANTIIKIAGLLVGAQIIITLIAYTGCGVKLSSLIVSLGQGNLIICLILSMLVCILLGMGMPTTAAYVLAGAVLVPALRTLGLEPLVANMFVFFFACMSGITPPVCAGVFMSSSIAQSDWWKTGWLSVLLALPAFVVPYTFAYNDALMLSGDPVDLVIGVVSALAGSYFIGIGCAGYLKKDVKTPLRCVFVISGILLIIPEIYISLIGLVIAAATWVIAGGLWKPEKVAEA
jgi:TRAP transporter 4TM/12TM fusion protein